MAVEPRPRLLVVTGRFPVVSETFVADHVLAMAEREWEVAVAYTRAGPGPVADALGRVTSLASLFPLGDEAEPPRTSTRVARVLRSRRSRALRSALLRQAIQYAHPLRRVMVRFRPAVVHAHFGHNAMAATLAAGRAGPPVVADFHGHDLTTIPSRWGWRDYRSILRGNPLVAHSEFAAGRLEDGLGRRPTVVRYGPAPWFEPTVRGDRWPTPLRLLVVGRLVPGKGVDVAIEALRLLTGRRPGLDPVLTVVGAGPEEGRLRSEAADAGLTARVRFEGALDPAAVAARMAGHDVLLVPSRPTASGWAEGFGLVAVEGRACSMAVVASSIGGLPEALESDGWLVDPDDPGALAGAIEHLVDHTTPRRVAESVTPPRPAGAPGGSGEHYDRLARSLLTGS